MKVGDIVLQITETCFKKHVKIIRETKLYWVVEFILIRKGDGAIVNQYERRYRKSNLHATNEDEWTSDTIQEIRNENKH